MVDIITDIDLVRWAFVKVLMVSPEFKTSGHNKTISKRLFAELMAASPKQLQTMLEIDNPKFSERVHRAIKETNERSKK
jgi:hypothetical protein